MRRFKSARAHTCEEERDEQCMGSGLNPEGEQSEVLAVQIRPGPFCCEQFVSSK